MTVFFVGGSPRSGTTLLAQVLSQAEGANPPIQEAQYFTQLIKAYQVGKTSAKDTIKDYFFDDQDFQQFNFDLVTRFFEQLKKRFPQTNTIVLKDPYLTPLFPTVDYLYPDSYFLVSIRDPRDTIASMIEVGRKSNQQLKQKLPLFANRDIPALVQFYKSFYTHVFSVKQAKFRQKIVYVKYEYLVENSHDFISKISQATSLNFPDFDANNMNQGTFKTDDDSVVTKREQPWRTKLQHGKKIDKSSIGNYQKILKKEEIDQINHLCLPILKRFNYRI